VRRNDAANGQLLYVLELREQHRLRVIAAAGCSTRRLPARDS